MYTLYYSPFACSFSVHATLIKLGVPFELKKIDIYKGDHFKPEFLAINPNAQVPVLQHGDKIITQASAILLYLSEQHPEADLMPAINSPERAKTLQSLFYLSNTLHPCFLRLFYPERLSQESPKDVKSKGKEAVQDAFKLIDQELEQLSFYTSKNIYAPDYYLYAMCNWLPFNNIDTSELHNLKAYIKKMKQLPEVMEALQKEMQEMAA